VSYRIKRSEQEEPLPLLPLDSVSPGWCSGTFDARTSCFGAPATDQCEIEYPADTVGGEVVTYWDFAITLKSPLQVRLRTYMHMNTNAHKCILRFLHHPQVSSSGTFECIHVCIHIDKIMLFCFLRYIYIYNTYTYTHTYTQTQHCRWVSTWTSTSQASRQTLQTKSPSPSTLSPHKWMPSSPIRSLKGILNMRSLAATLMF
jgi:hypothetical protein